MLECNVCWDLICCYTFISCHVVLSFGKSIVSGFKTGIIRNNYLLFLERLLIVSIVISCVENTLILFSILRFIHHYAPGTYRLSFIVLEVKINVPLLVSEETFLCEFSSCWRLTLLLSLLGFYYTGVGRRARSYEETTPPSLSTRLSTHSTKIYCPEKYF